MPAPDATPSASNFVRDLVAAYNAAGSFSGRVQTRFPPEPNGSPPIGPGARKAAEIMLLGRQGVQGWF